MVAKFTETVILRDPKSQATVAFFDGDKVPDWATDQVGPHVASGLDRATAKADADAKAEQEAVEKAATEAAEKKAAEDAAAAKANEEAEAKAKADADAKTQAKPASSKTEK